MSRIALLDVNVLVALFDDGNVGHDVAHDWFAENGSAGWASCPITENGFLRVLGNSAQQGWYVPLHELAAKLRTFCSATGHRFWPDAMSLLDDNVEIGAIRGHQQLTDVYLLGLAVKHDARFVTFDRSVPLNAVKRARREHLEVLGAAPPDDTPEPR